MGNEESQYSPLIPGELQEFTDDIENFNTRLKNKYERHKLSELTKHNNIYVEFLDKYKDKLCARTSTEIKLKCDNKYARACPIIFDIFPREKLLIIKLSFYFEKSETTHTVNFEIKY